ncbi:MAG: methionyl-tRNA formyltransferase [Opitutus sp.]
MPSPFRIVFLGSDPIALQLLNRIADAERGQFELVGVFTQPDRPVGRGQKITPNEVKVWAHARNLPVFQPEKLIEDVRLQLAALSADVALVMAYGHILRDDFIATPRLGTMNLHTSLLPKYRGASPIQTAVASGERETGVSFMRIVRRLDAGPVAEVERVSIGPLDTALEIEAKLAAACPDLVVRSLRALAENRLEFRDQAESAATFCRRLAKEDGVLDFTSTADVLAARINGLFPWPACNADINGQTVRFGLADAVAFPMIATEPGSVLGNDREGLLIAAGSGALRVRRLQRPGGKMLEADEFLRGFPIAVGTRLSSQAMPSLVGSAPFRK